MQRNFINVSQYKYLIEYYDANIDLSNNQYLAEFVMFRNYNILNDLVHDNDIYLIEKKYFNKYLTELKNNEDSKYVVFPVTNLKINSYSSDYVKFNDNFNLENNASIYEGDEYGKEVYELLGIENNVLVNKKIKCDKIRIYHPHTKRSLNAIIDISNYINNIHFHYLCMPLNSFETNSEKVINLNNESYSEFIEIYFPNMSDLFRYNDGVYNVFYKEDFNIIASTRNEKFINSIMSNSDDIEHYENNGYSDAQIVPFNLFIQPYRIVEEYAANSKFNYNDDLSDDEKIFVKLYLKNKLSINDNYLTNTLNIILYPYSEIDPQTKLYILDSNLNQGYLSINHRFKFNLMSRIGFSDGIISVVTLFEYPNKSYFYSLYKDDNSTSPIKEAYKYYNNIDDKYYNLFINDEVLKEIEDIDSVDSISDDIIKTVKEIANVNYEDKTEMLNIWKRIMKETIIKEYEEEFGTPTQFLGFKIDIASDKNFKHIIYTKNIRINFNDIDDFSFGLNNIFTKWEEKPEQLIVRVSFYDRILGIEISGNLVIITKEWFKYLINNPKIYRLTNLSLKNANKNNDDMNAINLDDPNTNINFINNIKCVLHKENTSGSIIHNKIQNQKIIFKPIFYQVKDLQNIRIRQSLVQNIAINLSEYLLKVESFKIVIGSHEYIEIGRNDILVIFKINSNELETTSGTYNLFDDENNYITSGNWTLI